MSVLNGSFYIQKNNQDFWLKIGTPGQRDGLWTRMGNIRDDGASGIVNIQPIVQMGFLQDSTLFRIRYIDAAEDFGFLQDTALTRTRLLTIAEAFGYDTAVQLDRSRSIVAAMNFGFNEAAASIRYNLLPATAFAMGFDSSSPAIGSLRFLSASPALGFNEAVQLDRSRAIAASMGLGFNMAADVRATSLLITAPFQLGFDEAAAITHNIIVPISASFAYGFDFSPIFFAPTISSLGFNMAAAIAKSRAISASFGLGFSQANVVQLQEPLTASFAEGFSLAAALSFGGDLLLSMGYNKIQPTSIGGTLNYTGGGAALSQVADGMTTTYAADAGGLTSGTSGTAVAYDFGSAKSIAQITVLVAPTVGGLQGWSTSAAMSIEYSDTSLTSGFTSTGKTVTVVGSASPTLITSTSFNLNAEFGAHRYWRIINKSGATGSNAWLAEVVMNEFTGFGLGANMAAALSLTNAPQIPVAVNTSFTFTSGAAEANLYDGVSGTYAADPGGENTNTHASYDLGSAKTITGVRIVTANANGGWTNQMVLAVQYSDTSLTAGWTSAGATITVPAGLNKTASVSGISAGSHRYWRVIYQSGTVVGANAWTDEIAFLA